MPHPGTPENMPPIAERRGCKGVWPARGDEGHETYDNNCPYCYVANGGVMD